MNPPPPKGLSLPSVEPTFERIPGPFSLGGLSVSPASIEPSFFS